MNYSLTFPIDRNQEAYYKIYQKVFPIMSLYGNQLRIAIWLILYCFQSHTNVTAFDISFNDFSQAQSIVFPANKLFAFINTKITYKEVILVPVNKLVENYFQNVRETLMMKNFIKVF